MLKLNEADVTLKLNETHVTLLSPSYWGLLTKLQIPATLIPAYNDMLYTSDILLIS